MNMTKATVNYRQEKTHMMSAVDRSFTDQSTLQEDERLGLSFMDTHGYSPRGECLPLPRGPQALLPQTPEPTAQSPPSADSVTPRTTGLSILRGTSTGPGDTEKAQLVICTVHWRSLQKTQQREEDARSSVTVVKGAAV